MSQENIIRAWKYANFRNSLSEIERALLPKNPAGPIELTDAELNAAAGGLARTNYPSFVCSHGSRC